jgi:flagellar basal body-associated protein FliL
MEDDAADADDEKPVKKARIKLSPKVMIAIAVVVVLAAGGGFFYYQQKQEEEERIAQEQAAAAAAAAAAKAAAAKRAAEAAAAAQDARADLEEFHRFSYNLTNKLEDQGSEYQHALDATGWRKILDSERLKQDKSLTGSKAIVQKSKEVVAKYRAINLATVDEARKDVAGLKVGEPARKKIMTLFEGSGAFSAETVNALWDCMDKEIAEYDAIFAQLSNKKVTWAPSNGKVLFTEQSDLDAFNLHFDAIREAAKKDDEIRERQKAEINITFDEGKPVEDKAPAAAAPGDAKSDAPKSESPKPDAPKAEAPKSDTPAK